MENNSLLTVHADELTISKIEVMKKMAEAHLELCKAMNAPSIEIKNCVFNSDDKFGVTVKKKQNKRIR